VLRKCLLAGTVGFIGLVALSAAAQNVAGNQSCATCECSSSARLPCPVAFTLWYGNGHFDPARQEEKLSKLLKLTPEQQLQVLDALKSAKSQLEALRSDPSLSRRVRKCKIARVRQASNGQILASLDKKQNAKLVWMQKPYAFSADTIW
jgi:Spy/CpxP family protein refolding chaperone